MYAPYNMCDEDIIRYPLRIPPKKKLNQKWRGYDDPQNTATQKKKTVEKDPKTHIRPQGDS